MIQSEINYGACSSTAERLTVDEEVKGSKPFRHPQEKPTNRAFHLTMMGVLNTGHLNLG